MGVTDGTQENSIATFFSFSFAGGPSGRLRSCPLPPPNSSESSGLLANFERLTLVNLMGFCWGFCLLFFFSQTLVHLMVFFSSGGPSGRLRSCPLPPPDSSKGGCALCKLLQQEVSQFRVQTKKHGGGMGKKESGSVFVAYLQSGGVARRGRGTKQTLGRRM